MSDGNYAGIAPLCNIVSIKILNHKGEGTSGSVLAGLQWMLDNKEKYNIRIANLSIGTSDRDGKDPLINAVNAAWDSGIIITVAAGNNGPQASSVTSPGISKKVITVGASDDGSPVQIWGDSLINFSGRGPTPECIVKPDVVAPGSNIISCLTDTPYYSSHGDVMKKVGSCYVQLSGTSMSTPIVAGALALYIEKNPHTTPNDVKLRLRNSTIDLHRSPNQQGWGLIDIQKLMN